MKQLLDIKTEEVMQLSTRLALAEQKLAFLQIDQHPSTSHIHRTMEDMDSFHQLELSPIHTSDQLGSPSASRAEVHGFVPRTTLDQERRASATQIKELNRRLEGLTTRLRESETRREDLEQQVELAVAQQEDNQALHRTLEEMEDSYKRQLSLMQAEIGMFHPTTICQ